MTISAELLLKEIETYINKDVSVIDACVFFAEKYDIEIELIGEIVKKSSILKAKVKFDAERLNLMKEKSSVLPV